MVPSASLLKPLAGPSNSVWGSSGRGDALLSHGSFPFSLPLPTLTKESLFPPVLYLQRVYINV